ncbi:translocation protein SEC62-like isoform X2 [Montipora capricornis]|uniref:translocation protein SEC62-like isoform X2 n=1 Tax=Montipora foliosa TaxID=591990 RepID=UPI0035F20802
MADQPKAVKRRKKKESREENQEPTKEENDVGKYLRFNCPSKSSSMHGQKVEYFIGSKAVDCLLDSKWASGKGGTEILFTDRLSVETYLDKLLLLGFFNRVVRIKKVKKTEKEKEKEREKEKEGVKEKEEAKKKKQKKEKTEEGKKSTEGAGEGEGKKTRKIKVKLELSEPEEQYFVDDDNEAYVWYFDPVHPKTIVMGALVVVATIAICLFPLWPSNIREYVWYLSVLAAAAVGSILVLAVLRYVFFAIVWVLTWGRHHFWLLPNLTEECGFKESFIPLYTHEYKGKKADSEPGEDENEDEKEDENLEEKEKQEEAEVDGNKDESGEDKADHTEQESWVKLTEEEVATAISEVAMQGDNESNDLPTSEVKC